MSWSYSYNTDIWPAIITLAVVIYFGSYSWQRRNVAASRPFMAACCLTGFWTLGVILELMAVDFSTKVFWVKYQGFWPLPTVATVACFILHYAGLGKWLTRRTYALLFLFPLLSVLMVVTNNFHHLIWAGFQMNGSVVASPGKLFWVFNSYIYLLGLFNFTILVRLAIHSPGHRLPVAIILSGQVFGRIGYTLGELGMIGPAETMLLSVGTVSVAYGLVLLRFHALDPIAAARRAVQKQMNQGLLTIDLQERIIDVNPMASAMLGIPEKSLRGKPLAEVMPMKMEILQLENRKSEPIEIMLGRNDSSRQYDLNITKLRGRQNEMIGYLLLLQDVTEQRKAQNQIIEQRKMMAKLQERENLARELHDGIGQILGYVSIQVQTALKWMQKGNADKAGSILERIAEVAKDAHTDIRESILALRTGSEKKKAFIPNLKSSLDRFQTNFGIRTELWISPGFGENTFDPAVESNVLRVIQEALTNSRKHSSAKNIKVWVELDTSKALITLADDGQGFDTNQPGGCEGSHFGLVFMRERIAQIGGALTIDSVPGGGTVLKLSVPVREEEVKRNESASGR